MGKLIGAAEFKANCLRILDEVERSGEPVTVTKRGRPVAELKPVKKKQRAFTFGCMKGTVLKYERPFDPAIDPMEWEANR
jgi:prevent-host-death family protein